LTACWILSASSWICPASWSTDSFAFWPAEVSGLPSPFRSAASLFVESRKSSAACWSLSWLRLPPRRELPVFVIEAVQVVIDLGVSACLQRDLGSPTSYADAFHRLARAGIIDQPLAERLARAAGFRNVIAHAYDELDMERVFRAARDGPRDLEAFLSILRDRL
jgi:uncharacterized protein YutE (UPF0331/DUF86 family)